MPRPRGPRRRLEPGLYQDDIGYAACVSVGTGPRALRREKRFPPSALRREMREWIARTRGVLLQQRDLDRADGTPAPSGDVDATPALLSPSDGTLRQDARTYLELVDAMSSFAARQSDLAHWVRLYGDRPTRSLTIQEIKATVNRWAKHGVAVDSVKHRMTALSQVFEQLYPEHLNPVRKVKRPAADDHPPRALREEDVTDLFAAMPDSATKARWWITYQTGLPPARLMLVRPEHLDCKRRTLELVGRRKGKGTKGKVIPITADAVAAFDQLARLDGYGAYASRGTSASWERAWTKANAKREADASKRGEPPTRIPPCRPYDLRHTFGTRLYALTGDLQVVAELLDCTLETARRYARGAVPVRLEAAVAQLDGAKGAAPTRGTARNGRKSASRPRLPKPARRVRFP